MVVPFLLHTRLGTDSILLTIVEQMGRYRPLQNRPRSDATSAVYAEHAFHCRSLLPYCPLIYVVRSAALYSPAWAMWMQGRTFFSSFLHLCFIVAGAPLTPSGLEGVGFRQDFDASLSG